MLEAKAEELHFGAGAAVPPLDVFLTFVAYRGILLLLKMVIFTDDFQAQRPSHFCSARFDREKNPLVLAWHVIDAI